jgi:glutathione synthase/RimK-type ligase-like ATP-grasp enzyme
MAFIRALSVFEDARWVNDPVATFRAENKAWQLRVASTVGFDVPTTLISNDREAPVPATIGNPFALKALDTVLLREGRTQTFAFTQIVQWSACSGEDFQNIPSILQMALHDKLDLRVTIVGEQLWCVAVHHNERGINGDWRLRKKEELSYETYELPSETAKRCFALMRRMGLSMAGIDLAFSGERYWFIEINPTGEWGWLDNPDRPIASTIASNLSC